MSKLKSKCALVTGGSRSIGQAIALKLAQEGADIVITYRNNKVGAEETVDQITKLGRRAKAIQVDLSKPHQLIEQAIDFLVNNAATGYRSPLLDINLNEIRSDHQVNIVASLHLIQRTARHMIDHNIAGSIINITSIAAALLLASNDSSWITGTTLTIDGGHTITIRPKPN